MKPGNIGHLLTLKSFWDRLLNIKINKALSQGDTKRYNNVGVLGYSNGA